MADEWKLKEKRKLIKEILLEASKIVKAGGGKIEFMPEYSKEDDDDDGESF